MKKALTFIAALAVAACTACGNNTDVADEIPSPMPTAEPEPAEINVFAATSLSDTINDIVKKYNNQHPEITVSINADSSENLQKQIEDGAECDIFFSAAEMQMNTLNSEGLIVSDTMEPIIYNKIAIIKPKEGITLVTGFDNIYLAENIALGGENVPAGSYAHEIFDGLGISDKVMAREISEYSDAVKILSAVAEGLNEVGVVYSADAVAKKDKVEIIAEADEALIKTPILYPAARVKNESADEVQSKAADAFFKFLKSESAHDTYEYHGFGIY